MIRQVLTAAAIALLAAVSTISPAFAADDSVHETIVSETNVSDALLTNQSITLDDSHDNTAHDDQDVNQCQGC